MMSNQKVTLSYQQLAFIVEQTGISDPSEAMKYFGRLMMQEGIRPRYMPQLVDKMMQRQRKQK